ncbi:hypothetical protein [Ktedonospora formicarum]|uniref:hypothetical protein n=1 Tax=Ktedonospora formicarum TaxID=2778364 RepID=UPI001C68E9A1|nr:hypothetical protein [Ktedonospora formicarum]
MSARQTHRRCITSGRITSGVVGGVDAFRTGQVGACQRGRVHRSGGRSLTGLRLLVCARECIELGIVFHDPAFRDRSGQRALPLVTHIKQSHVPLNTHLSPEARGAIRT